MTAYILLTNVCFLEKKVYYMVNNFYIFNKGKGTEETFWLVGKKGFTKPLPVPPPVGKDG